MENEGYQPSPEEQMTDEQRQKNEDERFEALQAKLESGQMSDEEIVTLDENDFNQLATSSLKTKSKEQSGTLVRQEEDDLGINKVYRLTDGTLALDRELKAYE